MTGSGTLVDPYIIQNVNDLQNIALNLTAYYELENDLDASATSIWNQLIDRGPWAPFTAYFVNDFVTNAGKKYYCIKAHTSGAIFAVSDKWMQTRRLNPGDYLGFRMLGTFTGHLDGKNYKIEDLVMNLDVYSSARLGLFYTNTGTIKNLKLVDCSVTVSSVDFNAGAAALMMTNYGTIENCHVSGTILATTTLPSTFAHSWAAGLAQFNIGTIRDCSSSCTVIATGDDAAEADGFISENWGEIRDCFSTGIATATSAADACANGFIFWNYGYTAGGIHPALIIDCYTRVNATAICTGVGPECASGFLDQNSNDGSTTSRVINCYSTGIPTGNTQNGFSRVNSGDIMQCFWDSESSGAPISNGGTGKTTSEMKETSTFIAVGWDFSTIWDISRITTGLATSITAISAILGGLLDVTIMNDLYPILQWQTLLGPPCNCGFEWAETEAFGNLTPVEARNSGQFFAKPISGLESGRTYYYRARAASSPGPIYGGTKSFSTLAAIEVETLPATNITENSARIWGRVRKVPVTAMARFDWGGNIEYGAQTPWAPGLISDDTFYYDLRNLAEGRAYHFRAVAMGSALVYGNDMTFTTRSPVGPVVLIQEELAHLMEVS